MISKKTILLVEDDAIQAYVNKNALEEYGYSVITAASGADAIKAAETQSGIDLILMDIDLGEGIDGTQAAGCILQNHDIPVLFLSSHTEQEIVEKTEKITSYGYVVKSSGITVLDASIKMAFKLFNAQKNSAKKENALCESEKIILWLSDSADEIILSVDSEGTIKLLNNSGHSLLGYRTPELIGKNWVDCCVPEESKNEMRQLYEKLQAGGTGNNSAANTAVVTKSGERKLISWHHAVHRESGGKFAGIFSSGRLVTEK